MNEAAIHQVLLASFLAVALLIFAVLLFLSAPYGRHSRNGWGPKISSRAGWVLMELPAVLVLGLLVFLAGFVINLQSDAILRRLRRPGESGYQIPSAGLFRWVSCPNYLGEMLEWSGWAIATWSLAGLAFALWTVANLLPRALSHHAWYRATFPAYPPERRALVPHLF